MSGMQSKKQLYPANLLQLDGSFWDDFPRRRPTDNFHSDGCFPDIAIVTQAPHVHPNICSCQAGNCPGTKWPGLRIVRGILFGGGCSDLVETLRSEIMGSMEKGLGGLPGLRFQIESRTLVGIV